MLVSELLNQYSKIFYASIGENRDNLPLVTALNESLNALVAAMKYQGRRPDDTAYNTLAQKSIQNALSVFLKQMFLENSA